MPETLTPIGPDCRELRPLIRAAVIAAAVLLFFYLMYFSGLGKYPLIDPDEPIYGQFVKEMVASHDWLTPTYDGKLWFDKPPMYYWLASVCVKAFGQSEFSLRLPSAVFASLVVLMAYLLAAYDFGKRAGLLAAVIAGTSLMQIILSHAAATDAVMVFFIITSLYAYRRWLNARGNGRLVWMAVCGASTGLGMLTKGPVVPVLLAGVIMVHLIWSKMYRKLRLFDAVVGIGLCLIIGLPWFLEMYRLYGQEFINGFIVKNNISRFAAPLHKSQTGQWYSYFRNIPMLLLFFFPWSIFVPSLFNRQIVTNPDARLPICWAGVMFVFFSISKTQNFTYTYPVLPALAILIGSLLSGREQAGKKKTSFKKPLVAGLFFSLIISTAVYVIAAAKYPGAWFAAMMLGAAMILTFAAPLAVKSGGKISRKVLFMAGDMVLFTIITVHLLLPCVSDITGSKALAEKLLSIPNAKIATYKLWRPGLFYYLGYKPTDLSDSKEITKWAQNKQSAIIVTKKCDEADVKAVFPSKLFGYGNIRVYSSP